MCWASRAPSRPLLPPNRLPGRPKSGMSNRVKNARVKNAAKAAVTKAAAIEANAPRAIHAPAAMIAPGVIAIVTGLVTGIVIVTARAPSPNPSSRAIRGPKPTNFWTRK